MFSPPCTLLPPNYSVALNNSYCDPICEGKHVSKINFSV